MPTKAEIIQEFLEDGFYPDCPSGVAENLFDNAAKTVLRRLRIRNGSITISLTQGEREYDLSATVLEVQEAYYEQGEGSQNWIPMYATTLDSLARGEYGWRTAGTVSWPSRYYLNTATDSDSNKQRIGFDPIPGTTTGVTYPRVRIYGTIYDPLGDSDIVYGGLLSSDVFLFHMAKSWAIRQDPDKSAYWIKLYQDTLAAESKQLRERAQGAPSARVVSPFNNRLTPQI